MFGICQEQIRDQDLSSPPLTATYVRGAPGGPRYLAISVHGIVGDNASREILLTDIFTAFGQRLAGEDIALQPVTTIVAGVVAALRRARHPSGGAGQPRLLARHRHESGPAHRLGRRGTTRGRRSDEAVVGADCLTETGEIDDARRRLQRPIDEMLLAALGRTIAATVGDGVVAVDLGRTRPIGAQARCRPAPDGRLVHHPLSRRAHRARTVRASSASQLLDDVHDTLNAVPHYGIGYGLLRYLLRTDRTAARRRPPRRHLLLLRGH